MANNFSSDSNCVAVWRFEDSPGFAADSKGANTLTNDGADEENATYKEGSQSASFVLANTDYMYITDANQDAGFPFRNADGGAVVENFSICFWVYFNSLPDYCTVIAKWDDVDDLVFCLLLDDVDKLIPIWGYNNGASYEYDTAYRFGTACTTGRWYHIAWTYEQSTRAFRLRVWDDTAGDFLDTDATGTITNDIDARDVPFAIGAQSHGAYYTNCYMDEVVVFNRVLSTDEIDDIRAGTFQADVEITPGVEALNLATYQADVNKSKEIDAGTSVLNLATYQADVNAEVEISAASVNLELSTYQSDVNAETEVDAGTAGLSLQTYSANVNAEVEIDAGIIALTLQTYSASVSLAGVIAAKSFMERNRNIFIIMTKEEGWH